MTSLPHDPTAGQLCADLGAGEALEQLRRFVEGKFVGRASTRRPSWAPKLTIEGELREACVALGWLSESGESSARLWANFGDSHSCGGFELRSGADRDGELIWTAKAAGGEWVFGPPSPTTGVESAEAMIEKTRQESLRALDHADATLDPASPAYAERLAAIEARFVPELTRWCERLDEVNTRIALLEEVCELAGETVGRFAAAIVAEPPGGICTICGRRVVGEAAERKSESVAKTRTDSATSSKRFEDERKPEPATSSKAPVLAKGRPPDQW